MIRILSSILLAFLVVTSTVPISLARPLQGSSNSDAATASAQARRVYSAIAEMNWRALHILIALSARAKRGMPTDADEFALSVQQGFEQGFKSKEEQAQTEAIFRSISDISLGQPRITGNKAIVPTSARVTVRGQVVLFKGVANMIRDAGVWKLDLTYTDDVERATSEQVLALIGKPDAGEQ